MNDLRSCLFALALAIASCSSETPSGSPATSGTPASQADGAPPAQSGDAGREDGRAPPGSDAGSSDAGGLPFVLTRPPVGDPVPPSELAAITDKYIALLTKTRYFDVLDERVLGWPMSDPQHRFWYGTWWSGCGLDKSAGAVTFEHVDVGADNNGIPTSAVLEGVCLAHALWPSAKLEMLARRLIRGFHAYALAMQRSPADPAGVLLARTVYPPPIAWDEGGRQAFIDYAPDRPGVDSYTDYVHIANNPSWGDVWVKNKRSKDDVGHMLRAIATLEDCAGGFGPDARADLAAMRGVYAAWAQRVETDGWAIATLDKSANVAMPALDSTMSRYSLLANAECDAAVSLRLFGSGAPGNLDCGDGIHPLEALAMTNEHNGEIVRSYHEAAVRHALASKQYDVALKMLGGLVRRLDDGMNQAEANKLPVYLSSEQLVSLLVESANAGVPLTWREVRWLHAQIERAFTSYVTNGTPAVYRVFDPSTPDGSYVFTPEGEGVDFTFFATLAGTCTAAYKNPATATLFDCARLGAWAP